MCWSIDANSAEALSIADSMMVSNPDLYWMIILLISSRTVLLKIQMMASYFSVFLRPRILEMMGGIKVVFIGFLLSNYIVFSQNRKS